MIKTPWIVGLPALPDWIETILSKSEWYRKKRRRRKEDPGQDPTRSYIRDYPIWVKDNAYYGYDTYYTNYNGRYFSIGLNKRENLQIPYQVSLDEWRNAISNNQGILIVRWESIEDVSFATIDEAEDYRLDVIKNFDVKIMESSL